MSAMVGRLRWLVPALCLALGSVLGCAGAGSNPNAPDAEQVRSINQKLEGPGWRLLSFVPDGQPGAKLQELLTAQFGSLAVRFSDGRVVALSSGVDFDHPYRIKKTESERFLVVITDEQSRQYEISCEFDPSGGLGFHVLTDPWKGKGELAREADQRALERGGEP
ncbi:MAG: hypothetical protein HY744_31535 [Deltaproteobacteria bacterium]|nr:hypothetical protein [Deltaproteobacteria bacterium]